MRRWFRRDAEDDMGTWVPSVDIIDLVAEMEGELVGVHRSRRPYDWANDEELNG